MQKFIPVDQFMDRITVSLPLFWAPTVIRIAVNIKRCIDHVVLHCCLMLSFHQMMFISRTLRCCSESKRELERMTPWNCHSKVINCTSFRDHFLSCFTDHDLIVLFWSYLLDFFVGNTYTLASLFNQSIHLTRDMTWCNNGHGHPQGSALCEKHDTHKPHDNVYPDWLDMDHHSNLAIESKPCNE